MKLEELLGPELYAKVQEKLDAANANEPDKLKHIRYADLSEGNYINKGEYDALNEQLTGKQTELDTANGLIADLKKNTKGNEELQGKITTYESQMQDLQTQLAEIKLKSAIKVALLSEKATDVDYLTFKLNEKLKEKGETLELDENENIKGWDDRISALKTQFPTMFDSTDSGKKNIIENKLQTGDDNKGMTRSELLKMPYNKRMEYYNSNPEGYEAAMHSEE